MTTVNINIQKEQSVAMQGIPSQNQSTGVGYSARYFLLGFLAMDQLVAILTSPRYYYYVYIICNVFGAFLVMKVII